MSIRTSSNVGHKLTRQIGQAFSGNAVQTADPNTLNSNTPSVNDAMGISGYSGTVSYGHDSGAARTFTIYMWSPVEGKWRKGGPSNSVYQQSVDVEGIGTFEIDEATPFFLSADATIPNLFTGGCQHYSGNLTADIK